jgi:hypothetical protein
MESVPIKRDPDRPTATKPPVPGWVKGFVFAGALLFAVAAMVLATAHGPGRHFGAHTAATP